MNEKPEVSVIIPAYQAASTLERAVRSVQSQTFKRWEILIINDGSTDETENVATGLADQDARIRLINQGNQGPAAARNHGADVSNGEYLAFLDADDEWLPHKLQGQVRILADHPQISLVICDSVNVDLVNQTTARFSEQHQTTLQGLHSQPLSEDTVEFCDSHLRQTVYRANFIHTSTVMIRRDAFVAMNGFNRERRGTEDVDLWIRLAPNYAFAYWQVVCAHRYKDQRSVSWRSEAWLCELIRFHTTVLGDPQFTDLHVQARKSLAHSYRNLIRYYGRCSQPEKAFKSLAASLKYGLDLESAVYAIGSMFGPSLFWAGGRLSRWRARSVRRSS